MESLQTENEIFGMVLGDEVVKAVFTFVHNNCICFVMEYIRGGDLSVLLNKYESFDVDTAKFYIAEIILAVEHLHKNGIIHRDLKPENFLIDNKGHLKLIDFGLSNVRKNFNKNKLFDKCLELSMKKIYT